MNQSDLLQPVVYPEMTACGAYIMFMWNVYVVVMLGVHPSVYVQWVNNECDVYIGFHLRSIL